MAKFTIYSPTGTALYTGTPTFTGQYMKPGMLEFREVAIPSLVDIVPGCYVDYTRTGHRYRIYTAPQLKKQARTNTYGGAFVYQSVQLYDASKMLEYCPFRDLVLGDNRIHFSTQPSISTFEGCDGLARRFEACLQDQYGANSWAVRIATQSENPNLYDLMLEPREFTVSGLNILECLDKIYEIWPEVGWIYKVENGKDTIVIGGSGINPNEGTYVYGKGNGLTSLTRTAANAEEIANRIFAYGSSRNMLPRWYNSQNIKDAESVDIQNLMLPVDAIPSMDWNGWGLTDGERDAAKAFVEDAASILKNGLRPATVYFDGKGEYPEIYPSIRETTIAMVRRALDDSTARYYPSTAIYTDSNARVDRLLSAQATFDSGLAGNVPGKSNVEMGDTPFSASNSFTMQAGETYYPFYHYQGTWTPETAGVQTVAWKLDLSGQVQLDGIEKVVVSVKVKDPSYQGPVILSDEYELTPDASGVVVFSGKEMVADKVNVSAVSYFVNVDISVYMTAQSTDKTGTYTASGNVGFALQNYRKKTFTISIRQIGFDINEQADLGNGKTIAMRTGDCAGRSFAIKSVQYNSANDCWDLECWRSEDESLSQWFPNSQFGVAVGDEFVLLDIAMPDIYIAMASEKLLDAARELLDDSAVERWQYNPEIDAKFMVENSRTINAGEYLLLSDTDIIGPSAEAILVDTITINEGEAAIPTYKVTLRDRKKKTWTESQSPEQSSSKSVGSITGSSTQQSSNGGNSYFQLDEDGNVTLKPQYQNLWVQGWLAAGGIGQGGSGGGGGLIDSVLGVANLNTPIATEVLTETFSSKAIQTIWDAVKVLQNTTPNVSLVNGANNSTLTVNGTTADFYTKSQVDTLLANIDMSTKADKVSGATAGNFAGLDANGNLTDSGHKHGDYVTALGTNGNNLTWTKNGQTSDITVPFATNATTATKIGTATVGSTAKPVYINAGVPTLLGTVGTNTMPVYLNNGTITQISSFREAYLSWGGKNFSASYGPIDAAMVSELGACRTMFLKAAGIVIEYSTDAGATWVDYGATDAQKVGLFSSGNAFVTGKASAATASVNNMLRVTMHTSAGGIYTTLNKFVIFVTTSGSTGCYCTIRCRTQQNYEDDVDTWVVLANQVSVSGWSGYNVINISGTTTYGNTKSSQYGEWQFIFGCTGHSGNYAGLSVSKIFGFGGVGWSTPSNMAKTGHLYAYDALQNATFPAGVYTNVNGSDLGSSSKRWKLYATAGDFGGNVTVGGTFDVTGAATLGSTLSVASAITLSGSTNTARRIYFGDANHYLELDQYGFHFSHGVYSEDFVSAGGIGNGGGSGSATELGDLVDVSLANRSNGDLLVYNSTTSHWENKPQSSIIPTVSIGFSDLTSHPTTLAGYGVTDAYTKTEVDSLISGIDLSDYALKTGSSGYNFEVGTLIIGKGTLKEERYSGILPPARPRPKWEYEFLDTSVFPPITYTGSEWLAYLSDIPTSLKNPYSLTFGSKTYDGSSAKTIQASDLGALTTHQSVTLASGTNNGTLKLTTAAGTVDNIAVKGLQALAYKASLLASDIPDISGTYVTLAGAQTITGAKTFAANLTLSENLVMGAAKHIDIGPARIEYDASTGAIHVTTNQTGNNAPAIGFYADGFNAAGGVGANGGGGGYGVESITSNQDGTVDFHFTGGDVTTVDLNHEHPQYNSKMAETSQPSGGFLPDVVYELGTLTGSVTFALASAVSGQVNHYFWTFTAGSTAPTITWPSGITWVDSAPTITAGNKYQISILDGVAAYMEA